MESLPNYSLELSLGAGVVFTLSSSISLDIRYAYNLDNKTVNTNNFIVGVIF